MSNTYLGDFSTGKTIEVFFDTVDGLGASVTITTLAITDIEIFKDGGTTTRSSDNGYALLDTDGIDFSGIVGIHGFTIDTSDNSDSGFYAAGSNYLVVVSAITLEGQTVSFIAAEFSIQNRAAGVDPDVAAIKVVTDKFVFTKANEVDANTVSINDAEVVGDGNAAPWDGA